MNSRRSWNIIEGPRKISEIPAKYLCCCYAKHARPEYHSEIIAVHNMVGSSIINAIEPTPEEKQRPEDESGPGTKDETRGAPDAAAQDTVAAHGTTSGSRCDY